jgi:hypothetical protein
MPFTYHPHPEERRKARLEGRTAFVQATDPISIH